MNRNYFVGTFVLFMAFLLLFSCSKEDSIEANSIVVKADKNPILLGFDTLVLNSTVQDNNGNVIDNASVIYLVDGTPISGNTYIPQANGTLEISASFAGASSDIITVDVVSLDDGVENLRLKYGGNGFLTTNPWSVAGRFSSFVKVGQREIEIPLDDTKMFINDAEVAIVENLHFSDAGDYGVTIKLGSLESNKVTLKVREEKNYPQKVIPVIFHTYGINDPSSYYPRLIDTLNSAFSKSTFSRERVINGSVNANAVNCFISFELVDRDKKGVLISNGINKVAPSSPGRDTVLTSEDFTSLEQQNNLDPNEVINIWVVNHYDFQWEPINVGETQGSGSSTGLANTPVLAQERLPGIPTLDNMLTAVDTSGLSHSIVLRAGSLFGSHTDFIVRKVGYHLGLFDTFAFGCSSQGDHCDDTFVPDLSLTAPPPTMNSCNGVNFRPSNFMSIMPYKNNFTYDQRERLRFILEHGLNRP